MTYSSPNPLSREQKLLAEQVVQLGNIVEQLEIMNSGGSDNTDLLQQVETLQQSISTLQSEKASLIQQLQQAQQQIVTLQEQVASSSSDHSVTPDNIMEVMNHLDIDYQQ